MKRHHRKRLLQTGGAPIYARDCHRVAVVPVNDGPTLDLCSALTVVAGFSLAMYAKSVFAARLARTLERHAGALDLGSFSAAFRLESRRTRTAVVQGDILVADGRSDHALFGGHSSLLHDGRRWEGDDPQDPPFKDLPLQVKRLHELEEAGVDVVEFPTNPAVDMRFAGLTLAQPVVICQAGFRAAEASGRVSVKWL